jgi:hypothetical protein
VGAADATGATGPARTGATNANTGVPPPPKFIPPRFEQMPAELKRLQNWVLWVAIWTGSKWTKPPIQVSGFGASTMNPKHWSSFEDVKHAYECAIKRGYIEVRQKGKPVQQLPIGGVGFVFDGKPDGDGLVYAGVDFDNKALEDQILSFSTERVKRFGSYIEASVSGTGVHVILKAHPLASGISHNGIEMYTNGRYFTMTGRTGTRVQPIIAAPVVFAALAEELQSQINVAMFVPGNEEDCRSRLARVVAADPWTYTLGDPTGPLVILRVPDREALPSETRWEGDLPGTTLASPADVMERAERMIWMREGKRARYRIRPPRDFITDYLTQMRGRYGARPLRGIVRVPRIDDSGKIHFNSGYDAQTGLFHDKSPTFDVPPNPSIDDARRAAEVLLYPFSMYQFADPAAGRALLLAAIFTAIERPNLPVAPMFVVRSSMAGTGKGLIVRALVRLAFDTAPVFITWGGSGEEFEKRLAALLLQTPGMISIDNANGIQIKGDLLESIITEGCADIRPLGHSKIVKVWNRSFLSLTGVNPVITGDMARRSLPIDILPRSADPERDRYGFNPVEVVQRGREDLLRGAFTIMRAFRLAGMPTSNLPAVGSFDDWSRRVRDLVYWLTDYDVGETFRQNKAEDPRRQDDAALVAALHDNYGGNSFKSADVFDVYSKVSNSKRPNSLVTVTQTELALYDALERVLGSKRVDAKHFGYWARRVNGAHLGGYMLETKHDDASNANVITIKKT